MKATLEQQVDEFFDAAQIDPKKANKPKLVGRSRKAAVRKSVVSKPVASKPGAPRSGSKTINPRPMQFEKPVANTIGHKSGIFKAHIHKPNISSVKKQNNSPDIASRRKSSWLIVASTWGLVVMIVVLGVGRYNTYVDASRQAQKLQAESAKWEQTQADLRTELARFTDPKYRESYWKWRTMRHEPSEHYIRFQDNTP